MEEVYYYLATEAVRDGRTFCKKLVRKIFYHASGTLPDSRLCARFQVSKWVNTAEQIWITDGQQEGHGTRAEYLHDKATASSLQKVCNAGSTIQKWLMNYADRQMMPSCLRKIPSGSRVVVEDAFKRH